MPRPLQLRRLKDSFDLVEVGAPRRIVDVTDRGLTSARAGCAVDVIFNGKGNSLRPDRPSIYKIKSWCLESWSSLVIHVQYALAWFWCALGTRTCPNSDERHSVTVRLSGPSTNSGSVPL